MAYASRAMDLRKTNTGRNPSVLAVGGVALALGAVGVTVTSLLYALSPPAGALPAYPLDQAFAGAKAGARALFAAGTVGIFSDIVMAVGAFLVALRTGSAGTCGRGERLDRYAREHPGLYVCRCDRRLSFSRPLAELNDGAVVFAGFKRLFDVLFLLGTVAFHGGAIVALADEMRTTVPIVSRPLAVIGTLVALAGTLAAGACFIGLPFGLAVGISIGLGAVVFAGIGLQIARFR